MKVLFHRDFKKTYERFPKRIRVCVQEQLVRFENDPFDPMLNNHPLKGKYFGYRSINITGDYRAVYEIVEGNIVHFIVIGTHSNLYK